MVYDTRCWMPGDGPLGSWIAQAHGRSSDPQAPSGFIDLHIGADLGRVRDHTAVAVTEVKLSRDYAQHYFVKYLKRFPLGVTWGRVVKQITKLRDTLKGSYGGTPVSLFWAIDATGVGSGVVSMLQAAMKDESIFSVYMTAGQNSSINEYDAHVGKYQLVSTLVGALNSGALHLPPDAADLVEELKNYEVRTSDAGRDSYNAKTGTHDDEVVALALSLWSCQNWGMYSDQIMW